MDNKLISEALTWIESPIDLYEIYNTDSLLYRIEDIEKVCRQSREYRGWTYWKRTFHTQIVCKELNINVMDYNGVRIEQDHFPITLFDVVLVVGMEMLSKLQKDETLTIFDIASRVMRIHLDEHNYIGTVSLTTTAHQLRHNSKHHLKVKDINGNYQLFLEKYKNYIPSAVQERIDFNISKLDL